MEKRKLTPSAVKIIRRCIAQLAHKKLCIKLNTGVVQHVVRGKRHVTEIISRKNCLVLGVGDLNLPTSTTNPISMNVLSFSFTLASRHTISCQFQAIYSTILSTWPVHVVLYVDTKLFFQQMHCLLKHKML